MFNSHARRLRDWILSKCCKDNCEISYRKPDVLRSDDLEIRGKQVEFEWWKIYTSKKIDNKIKAKGGRFWCQCVKLKCIKCEDCEMRQINYGVKLVNTR